MIYPPMYPDEISLKPTQTLCVSCHNVVTHYDSGMCQSCSSALENQQQDEVFNWLSGNGDDAL